MSETPDERRLFIWRPSAKVESAQGVSMPSHKLAKFTIMVRASSDRSAAFT